MRRRRPLPRLGCRSGEQRGCDEAVIRCVHQQPGSQRYTLGTRFEATMPSGAQIRRSRVVTRPVIEADFEQWLPLWKAYNAFYGRCGKTALAKEITLTTWRRFFDPYEPLHALVAERGADLLGLAHYLFHRNTLMPTATCYLQDLFTSKAA